MPSDNATLHLLCGKIASGKSTLTAQLGNLPNTVVVSKDHWLSRLYPGEITSVADYVRCTALVRTARAGHNPSEGGIGR
jgi:predicted kinase